MSKDSTMASYQVHTAVFMPHQFTKVTMEDFDYVALIDHADHVDQINHGMAIGNLMGWDIPKNCGTHQSTTFGGGYLRSKG